MAYVGLRKPYIGILSEGGTYKEGQRFAKAIGIQVTPSYAEGSLNADDMQAEYDKEFNYADVTLNTDTIPVWAWEKMFGHAKDEGTEEITYKADDEAVYVGMAWISVEKVNGKRTYIGNFLTKVKMSEPAGDYATKGDAIEYKTPSISGRAIANEEGVWKYTNTFESEEEAVAWCEKKAGVTQAAAATQESKEATEKISATEGKTEAKLN